MEDLLLRLGRKESLALMEGVGVVELFVDEFFAGFYEVFSLRYYV